MSKLPLILRVLLGIVLIVFGANKFYPFMPMPPMEGNAATFMGGLAVSGYMFPLLGILEILIGVLLIAKKAVPFALILLAPLAVNMVLFHLAMAPLGIVPAAIVFVLNAYLIYANWDKFKGLFE
ncbi:MAG: DoxX family membrane protein [Flavobacteriaceae bacterium]